MTPKGWTRTTVGQLASDEPGALTDGPFGSNLKTEHYTDSGPRVVRLQNIGEGIFLDERAHISESHFARLAKHAVEASDVLVAMLGEQLPRACLAPESLGLAIVKADCARLRVNPVSASPRFVMHLLNSSTARRAAADQVHGVGRPRLGLGLLRALELPVAPRGEQDTIVAAIESYFSRLDAATAILERVQRNLERYRASVLKAAVEGRLVPTEAELAKKEGRRYEPAAVLLKRILVERRRRWEEAELAKLIAKGKKPTDDKWKAKYEEPTAPDTAGLPRLPEGWCWAFLDALLREPLRNGHSARESKDGSGVRTLTLSAVTQDNFSIANTKMTVADPDHVADLWLATGDILVERSNTPELVGLSSLYKGPSGFAIFPDLLIRVRVAVHLSIEFVAHVLREGRVRRFFSQRAQGIAGTMPKISQEVVARVVVALPPTAEQRRIVAELDTKLSNRGATSRAVSSSMTRITRLRQCILKWAFEGRLVQSSP